MTTRKDKMTDNLVELNKNGDIVDKVSGKRLECSPGHERPPSRHTNTPAVRAS